MERVDIRNFLVLKFFLGHLSLLYFTFNSEQLRSGVMIIFF